VCRRRRRVCRHSRVRPEDDKPARERLHVKSSATFCRVEPQLAAVACRGANGSQRSGAAPSQRLQARTSVSTTSSDGQTADFRVSGGWCRGAP
jgi:hypothetical protein